MFGQRRRKATKDGNYIGFCYKATNNAAKRQLKTQQKGNYIDHVGF
jgi:hypothetical protein